MKPVVVLFQKEASEILFSPRGIFWLLTMTMVLSVFCLLLVGSTELSLLDNAQVVYDMSGIVTLLGSLLGVIVGNDSIAGERERGSLTPLLLAPISRTGLLMGKIGGLTVTWIIMFAVSMPYFWAIGSTGQNLLIGMIGVAMLGTPVVLGFGFFSVGLAAQLDSSRSSLTVALLVLLVAGSPLLIGPSLRQTAIGRFFDAVNPFSAAVNAFDSMIIDSQSIMMQDGRLALVAAWLALTFAFALAGVRRLDT
jgi:ABC-type transport system involved in multi-copper enzyme maturation permease subunit